MIETNLIKALETKDNYFNYKELALNLFTEEKTKQILKDLEQWFEDRTEAKEVDWEDFSEWFLLVKHPMYKEEKKQIYRTIFEKVRITKESTVVGDIINTFRTRSAAEEIAQIAGRIAEGQQEADIDEIYDIMEGYYEDCKKSSEEASPFVTTDTVELISHVVGQGGYNWRLNELNLSLGPIRKGDFVLIGARPETGKCLAKGTEVLMYDYSIKKVEDIIDGDTVMGPDNTPRIVSGTTSGVDDMYKVSYPGGSYTVNSAHILSLKRSKTEGKYKHGDILNVPVTEYIEWPKGRKERYKGWRMGEYAGIYDCRCDNLTPYTIGLWLGDGHSGAPMFTNKDTPILEYLRGQADALGLRFVDRNAKNTGQARTVSLSGTKGRENLLSKHLSELGIFNDKHIPLRLLQYDLDSRLELLAGLVDSDGSVSRHGWEITQKRKRLSEDIVRLVRSVGYRTTGVNEKVVNGEIYYRVHFYPTKESIMINSRIGKIPKAASRNKGEFVGITVEPAGRGEYYGFCVDKDHLFVLGDGMVTHNTTLLASEATFIAQQLKDDEIVLWINNEEEGRKVMWRVKQACIGWKTKQMQNYPHKVTQEYEKSLGRQDKILVCDRTDMNNLKSIEKLLEDFNVGLLIIDQLRKVNTGTKSEGVQRLQELYTTARRWAKDYCPVITVHQARGDAEGVDYIAANQLEGCQTEIQGELDAQVMIGRVLDPQMEHVRYINIVKNKLAGGKDSDERYRHGRHQVKIVPEIGRYISYEDMGDL